MIFNKIYESFSGFINNCIFAYNTLVLYIGYNNNLGNINRDNFLLYDVFDKPNLIKKIVNPHIFIPKNNKDLVDNFRQPYLKFYPNFNNTLRYYPLIDNVMSLFTTDEKKIGPSNAFFGAFAGYWVHFFINSYYNQEKIPYQNFYEICPIPVYGITLDLENILRTYKKGKIRMRRDKTPLRIKDLTEEEVKLFNMVNPTNDPDLFICSIDRANGFVGNYVFHTLSQRNHNRICDEIYNIDKNFDDETAFRLAKTINFYQFLKIVLGPYASSLSPFYQEFLGKGYLAPSTFNYRTVDISFEYNIVYQFHFLLPEKLGDIPLTDIAYNSSIMYSKTIPEWISELQNTKCYTQNIKNAQELFKQIDRKTIEVSRKINLLSYCEYREKLLLSVPKTFYDVTKDEYSARELEKVYKKVENLEYYVGINSEPISENYIFGETTGKLLGLVALQILPEIQHNLKEFVVSYNNNKITNLIDDFKADDFLNKNIYEEPNPNFKFIFKNT
jgi:prostaglandin-endoperoxide synthase 2